MAKKPKLSVTGYRAIWGQDLDEQIAFNYARAYAKFCKAHGAKKILIARDARKQGPAILSSVRSAFSAEGIDTEYAGILPTPTLLLLVKKLGYDGGVMITASHNPPEYNGEKFVVGGGRLTNAQETEEIQKHLDALTDEEKDFTPSNEPHTEPDNAKFRKIHVDEVVQNVDAELIRSKKFKVALDPINSGGSLITQDMLAELGCETHVINGEMDGNFAHRPEPVPENLQDTANFVKETEVDIGFVQDPDADRLIVIDETGTIIGEEKTLALCIKNVLAKDPGDIVINLSTSSMSEEIAESFGVKTHRTKIGEANVVNKILEINAPIGGEGSSGAIYPKINTARDSLVGIALILELLAKEGKKTSVVSDELPKYIMKKENIHFDGNLQKVIKALKSEFHDAKSSDLDGVRFDWPDKAWVNIRASNTEPIVRIFGEAKQEDRIEGIFAKINQIIAA